MSIETRTKVTCILPRKARFADYRRDRNALARRPGARKEIKRFTKQHAALYKALRKDARFAAIHLYTAFHESIGFYHECARLVCFIPLEKHEGCMRWEASWKQSAFISGAARIYASAHPALSDPARIACYPTRAYAERQRELVMSPGKFFAAAYPNNQPHAVQANAEGYALENAPLKVHFIDNDDTTLDETELGNEWERVYRDPRGFSSCMMNMSRAIRFYALPGNGLSLAYLTHNGERDGDVVARSICNKGRKSYVRCYGDNRLAQALASIYGMQYSPYEAMQDVRCRARTDNNRLIAPYLDGDMAIDWNDGDSECTIVESGRFAAQSTEGYVETDTTTCDCCGDRYDSDDLTYSDYHEENICDSCVEEYYVRAIVGSGSSDLIHLDNAVEINDDWYLSDDAFLESMGFRYVDGSNEWFHKDDVVYLYYLSEYVLLDEVVVLDIPTDKGDDVALSHHTKSITLQGEQLTVHDGYDGPEDEVDEESSEDESNTKSRSALAA